MNKDLIELIAGIINVPASGLTMDSGPATHQAWDSLAHVSIVAAVEQTYGVNFTMAEILSIKTIEELSSMLARHRGK